MTVFLILLLAVAGAFGFQPEICLHHRLVRVAEARKGLAKATHQVFACRDAGATAKIHVVIGNRGYTAR